MDEIVEKRDEKLLYLVKKFCVVVENAAPFASQYAADEVENPPPAPSQATPTMQNVPDASGKVKVLSDVVRMDVSRRAACPVVLFIANPFCDAELSPSRSSEPPLSQINLI